jgi:hypothetical protein
MTSSVIGLSPRNSVVRRIGELEGREAGEHVELVGPLGSGRHRNAGRRGIAPARPDHAEADRLVQTGGRLGGDLVAVRAVVPERHAADLIVIGSDFRAALLVAPACG